MYLSVVLYSKIRVLVYGSCTIKAYTASSSDKLKNGGKTERAYETI
jgi:hypothetical protein